MEAGSRFAPLTPEGRDSSTKCAGGWVRPITCGQTEESPSPPHSGVEFIKSLYEPDILLWKYVLDTNEAVVQIPSKINFSRHLFTVEAPIFMLV